MIRVRTVQGVTDVVVDLAGDEQSSGRDALALGVNPLGFDGIEPGARDRQGTGEDADAFLLPLDLTGVGVNPVLDGVTAVPGGGIPDQEQGRLPLGFEFLAAPVQERNRHRAEGTPLNKAKRSQVCSGASAKRTSRP